MSCKNFTNHWLVKIFVTNFKDILFIYAPIFMFVCVPVVGTVVGASLGITVTGSRRWVGVKKIFSLRFLVSQRGCLVYKALVCCRSLYNFRQHFTVHFVMLNILWTYYLPRYVRLIELKMTIGSSRWFFLEIFTR